VSVGTAADGLDQLLEHGGVDVAWTGPAGEPVVTVTLDRPQTRNAQTPGTWRALAAVGENLPEHTRVVVVRGAGPVFSSGIDLRTFSPDGVDGEKVLERIAAVDDAEAADLIEVFQRAFSWWHDRDDVVSLATSVQPDLDAGVESLVASLLGAPEASLRATKKVLRGALVHDAPAQRRYERETQVALLRGLLAAL